VAPPSVRPRPVARGPREPGREPLLWLFSAFLVFAGAMMLFYAPKPRPSAASAGVQLALGASVGSVAGFLGGLLGVGGGNIVVPALVGLGCEPKQASATTSFVVIFSSLAGFLGHVAIAGNGDGHVQLALGDHQSGGIRSLANARPGMAGPGKTQIRTPRQGRQPHPKTEAGIPPPPSVE